jgi:hypothetical protein
VSIIDSILGKREPGVAYRTVDGGHPAPYPDMTDEQLYNYEITFNVPHKTFNKAPRSARAARNEREAPEKSTRVDAPPPSEPAVNGADADADARPMPKPAVKTNETMPPLDLTRPVRTITTRQPVEILTTKARHPVYPVHGYIGDDNIVTVFTLDGQLSENGLRFLENVPEKYQLHLNIYANPDVRCKDRFVLTQHETQEDADLAAMAERIACVKLQFDL